MKDTQGAITSVSQQILGIQRGGAAAFVRQKIQDRALHDTVAELNNDVLFGTAEERESARRALSRLGFAEV